MWVCIPKEKERRKEERRKNKVQTNITQQLNQECQELKNKNAGLKKEKNQVILTNCCETTTQEQGWRQMDHLKYTD